MIAEADALLSRMPKKTEEVADCDTEEVNPEMGSPNGNETSSGVPEQSGPPVVDPVPLSEEKRKEQLFAETKEQEERLKNETIE